MTHISIETFYIITWRCLLYINIVIQIRNRNYNTTQELLREVYAIDVRNARKLCRGCSPALFLRNSVDVKIIWVDNRLNLYMK